MKTISQRIEEAQKSLVETRDELTALVAKMDQGEDVGIAIDELTIKSEQQEADLERLQRVEKSLAAKSEPVEKSVSAPAILSNPGARVPDSKKADLLVKSALCAFDAYVKRIPVELAMEQRYGQDEAIKAVMNVTTKAAQNPAMTNVPAWAGALVQDAYGSFMDLLKPESVVPRLPLARYEFNGYNSIKIPSRTGSATTNPNLAAAFRAEGAPIRVGALTLGTTTLTPKSMGVIGTYTAEILERSTPSIEAIIRDAMIQDTAVALDLAFLGSTTGSATVPAGITAGLAAGNTAASAGTTAANIMADLRGRLQNLASLNMGRRPVFIMNPARMWGLQLATTAAGTPLLPELANGQLMGVPVVTSTTVPAAVIYLVDAAEVAFAGGAPRFMGTEVATIHEEDTTPLPIVDGAKVAASPVRSLFQTNSAALRCVWELDWAVMRPGAVQTITGAAY
jgi:HK97 family phage major capsid protein